MKLTDTLQKLGPGLLYAAAAIGVSHLVQSTRAGAQFGYGLIWAVIAANIIKYPFFKIAPQYTALTGKSLLEGYRKLGLWALVLIFIITLSTMFTIQAAVTIVSAGLANELFGLTIDIKIMSLIILLICSSILMLGRYNILDHFIKIIIMVLTVTTIISVVSAYMNPTVASAGFTPLSFDFTNKGHIFFLIALAGWMPAPLDVPIWHSLWSLAKRHDQKEHHHEPINLKDALLDFNVGYIGTALLALGFVSLGALVMYKSGMSFSPKAGKFSSQLIKMYTQGLGDGFYYIIAIACFTTMFSTTLTCLDAFPRVLRESLYAFNFNEFFRAKKYYNLFMLITVMGASIILFRFLSDMKALIDFATTLSFVITPIFAALNYMVINSEDIPQEHRPSGKYKIFIQLCLILLTSFSIYFLYLKYLT